jgi:Bacterial protein of unknown function (DUF899)
LPTIFVAVSAASRSTRSAIASIWAGSPLYTLHDDFDADHDVAEWHGTNVFLRDGDEVYRTYFIDALGKAGVPDGGGQLPRRSRRGSPECVYALPHARVVVLAA